MVFPKPRLKPNNRVCIISTQDSNWVNRISWLILWMTANILRQLQPIDQCQTVQACFPHKLEFSNKYIRANEPVTTEQHNAEFWVWSLSQITFNHISIWCMDDKSKDFKHTWDLEEWREDKFYTVLGHIKKFLKDYTIKKIPVPVVKIHFYCFEWSN